MKSQLQLKQYFTVLILCFTALFLSGCKWFDSDGTPDTEAPVITAPADITVDAATPEGTPSSEATIAAFLTGATASDNTDSAVNVSNNAPAIFPVGTTTVVTFSATDAAGNTGTASATVTVNPYVDTNPPVITLTGDNPQNISLGDAYVELGATAQDDVDGDLSTNISIVTSDVNTASVGTYTVTYDVSDTAGNAAVTVSRTIEVVDTTPPVITLTGANPQIITVGNTYTELGATATDNWDGDISVSLVIDASAVNTATEGSYSVAYDVSDSAGNAATTVVRTVTVQAASNDVDAPTASIVFPTPRSMTEGSTVYLRGIAEDASGVGSLLVNGVAAVTTDNYAHWTAEVPVNPGLNTLTVVATDISGNTNNSAAEITISRDLELVNPVNMVFDSVNNRVLVLDWNASAIIAIDKATGQRSILSNDTIPDTSNPLGNVQGFGLDYANNRVLVTDAGGRSLIGVDLTTGARTIISNSTIPDDVNPFGRPESVTVDVANDRALVADSSQKAIFAVDLTTGARTVLSDNTTPDASNPFDSPQELALDTTTNDRVFVADRGSLQGNTADGAVYAVNLTTGARSVISNSSTPDAVNPMTDLKDIVFDVANNRLLAMNNHGSEQSQDSIMSIDLTTGARTIISDNASADYINPLLTPVAIELDDVIGRVLLLEGFSRPVVTSVDLATGARTTFNDNVTPDNVNSFVLPVDIAFDATSTKAFVLDQGRENASQAVYEIDMSTGARTLISNNQTPDSINSFVTPTGLILDTTENRVLVADSGLNALLAVDLNSGSRTILSDDTTPDNLNRLLLPRAVIMDKENNQAIVLNRSTWSSGVDSIIGVDLNGGTRTLLHDFNFVSERLDGMALIGPTELLGAESGVGDIWTINWSTGDRSKLALTGDFLNWPHEIDIDYTNNRAVIADNGGLSLLDLDTNVVINISNYSLPANGYNRFQGVSRLVIDEAKEIALIVSSNKQSIIVVDLTNGERMIFSR